MVNQSTATDASNGGVDPLDRQPVGGQGVDAPRRSAASMTASTSARNERHASTRAGRTGSRTTLPAGSDRMSPGAGPERDRRLEHHVGHGAARWRPGWRGSSSGARTLRPMAPIVGLYPTSPQQLAGMRTEPPPSDDVASGTSPAASAAALPPLDPPGDRSGFHGLRVVP